MRWLERQLSRHLLQEENERQGLSLVLGTDPRHFTIDESEPGRFFFSVARTDNQISETEGDIQAISALRNQCQALISLIRFFQRKDKSTPFSAIQLPDSEDSQPITVQILATSSGLREKIYGLLADATMVVVVTFAFSDPAMAHALECVLRRGGLVEVWTGFTIESTYRKQQRLLTRLSVWPRFGWIEEELKQSYEWLSDPDRLVTGSNLATGTRTKSRITSAIGACLQSNQFVNDLMNPSHQGIMGRLEKAMSEFYSL